MSVRPFSQQQVNSNSSEIREAEYHINALAQLLETQQPLENAQPQFMDIDTSITNNTSQPGRFSYYEQKDPFEHKSIKDFDLKALCSQMANQFNEYNIESDAIFGYRNDNPINNNTYWKPIANSKNNKILQENANIPLPNGCIIFPNNLTQYIHLKYLNTLKYEIMVKNKWNICEIYPDKYCLYRIFQRLIYGENTTDKYLFVEQCVMTYFSDAIMNDETILNALCKIFNIIINVCILNMNTNKLERIQYGEKQNNNTKKVSIGRYNKCMYFIIKDYIGNWNIPLHNYGNIISANVVSASQQHKEMNIIMDTQINNYINCIKELFPYLYKQKCVLYEKIPMTNTDIPWSEKVNKLYEYVSLYYKRANHGKEDILKIQLKVMPNRQSNPDEKYIEYIEEFVRRDNYIRSETPYANVNINGQCVFLKDVISKVQIPKSFNHRVSQLNGEFGLFADRNIPKYTVLGRYSGVLMLEEEYNMLYNDTQEESQHNLYSFAMTVNTYVNHALSKCLSVEENKNNKGNKNNKNKSEYKNMDFRIVIDAWRLNKLKPDFCPFIFMNDCRKNINNKYPNEDDCKFRNIDYVEAYTNEWPSSYVVTRRDIKKGEELFCFYGPDYGRTLNEHRLQKLNQEQLNKVHKDIQTKLRSVINQ